MTYPINRGQVMGTPLMLNVTGPAMIADSLVPCELTPERQPGRWIHKPSLHRKLLASPWAQSFPENQEYIFQPYACKRGHHTALELANTTAVDSLLFVGDSVLRGAFCSQIWPQLAPSGTADGNCTFINDPILYHVAPKDLVYTTPGGRKIPLAFRFMDDRPNEKLAGIPASLNGHAPSHIIANLGLWLAPFPIEKYQSTVAEFLQRLFEMYPAATFIWRTTTDVAPMIQCFSDKGMTRAQISAQRDTSLTVVSLMRAKGMRIFVVDGYAMTTGRPDSGNDGRHWVVESPDEQKWLPKARPAANDAEKAILDGIWDVVLQDDLARANKAVAPA